jgi:DoxX-like family
MRIAINLASIEAMAINTVTRSLSETSSATPSGLPSVRLYWIAIGLFSALFLGSAAFGLLDLDGSKAEWVRLGYPWWTFFFLTAGKVVGVAAIVSNRAPRVVKDFAFAGFLYDLLLAGGAHLAVPEVKVVLPIAALGIWGFAFAMDSKRFPRS